MNQLNQSFLITIDVEDWFQVENFKPYIPYATWDSRELRVERNTHRLLDLFEEGGNRSQESGVRSQESAAGSEERGAKSGEGPKSGSWEERKKTNIAHGPSPIAHSPSPNKPLASEIPDRDKRQRISPGQPN